MKRLGLAYDPSTSKFGVVLPLKKRGRRGQGERIGVYVTQYNQEERETSVSAK